MAYQDDMDDLEEYPVGVRLRILAAQVKASANLVTWCFVNNGDTFFPPACTKRNFCLSLNWGNVLTFFMKRMKTGTALLY